MIINPKTGPRPNPATFAPTCIMNPKTKGYLALLYIAIIWGTTYLVIRVAVLHYPALLFAGIRQVISGLTIGAVGLLLHRKADWSWSNLRHQILIGFLMIAVGNGLVTWGEKAIPSGVAALICSMMPICAVIINLVKNRHDRVNIQIVVGMGLGFLGVGLIFKDDLGALNNAAYLVGTIITFIATFSWALGSVLNKRKTQPVNAIADSGIQLFFGGLFLLIASPMADNYTHMNFWQPEVYGSMIYLVVAGSVLAYTAYMYALRVLPVGIVTLYAYVNPLVAVVLGYYLLQEPLTIYTGLAFASIVAGVFIVNRGYRIKK